MSRTHSNFTFQNPQIFSAFPELAAGITLRQDTQPPYLDANFGFRQLEAALPHSEYISLKKEVLANRKRLASTLLGPVGKASFAHQTHSDKVVIASEEDAEGNRLADGIVSNTPSLLIGVFVADCAGILLYDPIHRVVGAVHAGWRGTLARVVPKTIGSMIALGASPEATVAYISPTACVKHYEVGEEFSELFAADFLQRSNGKLHFDNSKAVTAQLKEAGISRIEANPSCTIELQTFHSYRRDKSHSGRTAVCIGLKP